MADSTKPPAIVPPAAGQGIHGEVVPPPWPDDHAAESVALLRAISATLASIDATLKSQDSRLERLEGMVPNMRNPLAGLFPGRKLNG